MQGGNDTKVTHGLMAGAICIVGWWILKVSLGITPDTEVALASATILTGLFQYFMPADKL